MGYDNNQVTKAFKIYSKLAAGSVAYEEDLKQYLADDNIRALVDQFVDQVDCVLVVAGDLIYMIPKASSSMFHISNETIKKDYLPTNAKNSDIYLMYVATIVLFGEFYDGYQSMNPTRDFITMEEWLSQLNQRIFSINEHGTEKLKELEKKYQYNWIDIIEKWEALDDLKEHVKKQQANVASRLSSLYITKRFLEKQELINDLGNDEIELTQKAKIIVQRYYMEYDFNRGILDFIYGLEEEREDEDAIDIQDTLN
ncbi:DUF6063 family protein [Proteinivorax hydrogeniformans]|uniref:DUF6063 family protein n=1 Tax=Proteinivorax hydrogeniformans TaxID=1826727 RepID=A0AAU8HUL1_9FIRM